MATITILSNDTDEATYTFSIQGTGNASSTTCVSLSDATIYEQDFETSAATPELTYTNSSTTVSSGTGAFPSDNMFSGGTQGIQSSGGTGGIIEFATVDLSSYSNISFSVRLASFSTTSGNGAEASDTAKLFISTDSGSTYSEEITVTGASANNARWSFTSGTGNATSTYDGNNTTTMYAPSGTGDRTTDGYSTITLSGLPSSATLRVKIEIKNNSTSEIWVIDDAKITADIDGSTIWNSVWSNSTPTSTTKVVIDSDYDMSSNNDVTTCELDVSSGNTLIVTSGKYMEVQGNITNNGTIIIEDGGSLIQVGATSGITGTGTFMAKRNSTSLPSEHVYTYWSTPLTNSTLSEVVSNADNYYSFNAASQNWFAATASSIMTPGQGYITKGPTDGNFPGTYTAEFSGSTFNNGDISVALDFSSDGDADNDWNLIGNPYPSSIDADAFLTANSTIGGTLYFWTHNTDASFDTNFSQNDYVSWNGTGGTAGCTGCTAPDGFIASGQSFFAQALSTSNATFTNSIRNTGNNTNFYKSVIKKDRVWLNFSGENTFSQLLVGFIEEATNEVDRMYDGIKLEGDTNGSFYTLIDSQPFGIQGRSRLTSIEEIPLGVILNCVGDFKISIDHFEGKLEKSTIYLEDTLLNTKHNLKDSDYKVVISEKGTYNDRFKLIIETDSSVLDINDYEVNKPQLTIRNFTNEIEFEITSGEQIQEIIFFNLLGKEILVSDFTTNKARINSLLLKRSTIIIAKIVLSSGEILVNKIYID